MQESKSLMLESGLLCHEPDVTWGLAWGGDAGVSEGSGDVFNRHLQEAFWDNCTSLPNASPALWGSCSSGEVLSRTPSVGLLGRCT